MENELNTNSQKKEEFISLEDLPNDQNNITNKASILEKCNFYYKIGKEKLLALLDLKGIEERLPENFKNNLPENRRLITLPILVLLLGFFLIFLLAIFSPNVKKKSSDKYIPVVRVVVAKKENIKIPVYSQGVINPKHEIKLISLVNGPVIFSSPNFVDGGFVTKDELLLEISDRPYQQDKARVEANLDRAKAAQIAKQSELRVRGTLRSEAGISQLREVNSAVKAAEADVARVDDLIEDTKFKAPFSGLIRKANTQAGQMINAGTPIGSIFSTDRAIVSLPLSDRQLNFISLPEIPVSAKETATVKVGVKENEQVKQNEASSESLLVDALPAVKIIGEFDGKNFYWNGKLVRSAGGRNELNRLQYVTVEIDNPYGKDDQQPQRPPLSPGFFIQAEIEGKEFKDIVKLPRKALKANEQIWGVNKDNVLQSFEVELIYRGKDFIYVASGVEDGAEILISDLEVLAAGIEVKSVVTDEYTPKLNEK